MANGETIKKVVDIVVADGARKYIVVSAPGKRDERDFKVTDALYDCYDEIVKTGSCDVTFEQIKRRFEEIYNELQIDFDLNAALRDIRREMESTRSRDYAASRGEYLSAMMLAAKLNAEFVDAQDVIVFDKNGDLLLDESLENFRRELCGLERAVIPGFYGTDADGNIKTFSRGGSDITGAIVATAMNAEVYENWTDVDGFLAADPRIVDSPRTIDCLSYREMRELSYMGAEVLHPESIFPVRSAGIPINIKNTFNPDCPGTLIVAHSKRTEGKNVVTGIAGKKGFTIINIEKQMMNTKIGFGRRVLAVLEDNGISVEHIPSGIDTMSVVIRDEFLGGKMQRVLGCLQDCVNGDNIEIHSGLSLIATVGHNMASRQGTAATLFNALADSHVNIRMIDQGSSELNIIVGVDTPDYEKAINAIYHAFCG